MLNVIVVVTLSDQIPERFLGWSRSAVLAEGVLPVDETIKAKKNAIKAAMIDAVNLAAPGDVVVQDDIVFHRDPFQSPLADGTVTMLTKRMNPRHWCPQAFRFASPKDASSIIEAWTADPLQCCYGWQRLPKTLYLAGRHQDVDHN